MLPTVAPVFQWGCIVGSLESGCQITAVGKSALCGNVFQIFVAVFQQHAGFMQSLIIQKQYRGGIGILFEFPEQYGSAHTALFAHLLDRPMLVAIFGQIYCQL